MKIRKSTREDMTDIMPIYEYARAFMAEHGNPRQWGPAKWPPKDLILKDISAGCSYVCVNDREEVIGTFFYAQGREIEPAYADIRDGKWLDEGPYGVVHRIGGNGREKGIGAFCLNWAFRQCGHIRIDTHEDNIVMQNLLKKLGYTHCGTIFVGEDHSPRLAFEKCSLAQSSPCGFKFL